MTIKSDRLAYTTGYKDGEKRTWRIDVVYPRPTQTLNQSVVLSDGTVVNGSATVGWKPSFAKAVTITDAELLVDLWKHPTRDEPVDDV